MARNQNTWAKRKRELDKKRKAEEKREARKQRRMAKKEGTVEETVEEVYDHFGHVIRPEDAEGADSAEDT